ncbi:hypothetical protein AAVH_15465 [Aphelenchoides avenae]|nr:hypothetical protein AAVH_15465 [Aphelenchus avenae]
MYLPYATGDKSQHCFEGVSSYNVNGGNYVIKHSTESVRESKLNALLAGSNVVSKRNALVDYYSQRRRRSLQARQGQAQHHRKGFAGFAAVACGKKFVWYQLGYKYFAAAAVGGDALAINSTSINSYNPNCGQIIFFP